MLLILVGVTISAISGDNGILNNAARAKEETERVEKDEKEKINKTESIMNEYITDIQIGDYVEYNPTLGTYEITSDLSGSSKKILYTQQDINKLNWRYMGQDENGNQLLISDRPTEDTIEFQGANGYNNAVNTLDTACERLYSSEKGKARNLKIEDIESKINNIENIKNESVGIVKYGETKTYISPSAQYPYIYENEIGGVTDKGNTTGELNLSDAGHIYSGANNNNETLTVRQTLWVKLLSKTDFKNSMYYELFMVKNESYYPLYWISSRAVHTTSDSARFAIYSCSSSRINAGHTFDSQGNTNIADHAFRPVIVLNEDVEIDSAIKGGRAGTLENPYTLK